MTRALWTMNHRLASYAYQRLRKNKIKQNTWVAGESVWIFFKSFVKEIFFLFWNLIFVEVLGN